MPLKVMRDNMYVCMCTCDSLVSTAGSVTPVRMQFWLTDIHPSISTYFQRNAHSHEEEKVPSTDTGNHRTLISDTERQLLCKRGRVKKKNVKKNRQDRQTDGQRDRRLRTKVQWAQVGMKNGFRRRRRRRRRRRGRVVSPAPCPEHTLRK